MGLAPDRHPPEVVAAPAARGAGFAPRAALSPARVRTRGRARGAPKGQPDAGRCRLHARARRDPEGRLGAAPAAAGHVFLVPSFPSGARSLRLPHSPDAAPAAPGLGLLPPPSLRSPTPEALREGRGERGVGAAGAARAAASSSSGLASGQGRAVPSGAPWARSGAWAPLEAPPRPAPPAARARPLAGSSREARTCGRTPGAGPRSRPSPARQHLERGDNCSSFGLCPVAS